MALEYLEPFPTAEFQQFCAVNPDVESWHNLTAKRGVRTRPTEAHGLFFDFCKYYFLHGQNRRTALELHDEASFAYTAVAATVNSSLGFGYDGEAVELAVDTANPRKMSGSCGDVERFHFATTLAKEFDITTYLDNPDKLFATVYVDDVGEPVMVEKYEGEKNAITLKPIAVNGSWIPAGTVCVVYAVEMKDELWTIQYDRNKGNPTGDRQIENGPYLRTLPVSDIETVLPRRLTMWAEPTSDGRLLFARHLDSHDELHDDFNAWQNGRQMLAQYSLDDFIHVINGWLEQ